MHCMVVETFKSLLNEEHENLAIPFAVQHAIPTRMQYYLYSKFSEVVTE